MCCQRHGSVLYENVTQVVVSYLSEVASHIVSLDVSSRFHSTFISSTFHILITLLMNHFDDYRQHYRMPLSCSRS